VSLPTERAFETVDESLVLLEGSPKLERVYDPAYPAARLSFG
jgi:hypothetical protein